MHACVIDWVGCAQETEDVFGDDSDELQERRHSAFWRKRAFWDIYVPIVACIILLAAAILVRLYEKHRVPSRPSLLQRAAQR